MDKSVTQMFDDVAAYFYENVLLAYLEYDKVRKNKLLGQSRDLRLAINAAIALYHFKEHLPKDVQRVPDEMSLACPDYPLLGDVVNAAKHGHLTRGNPLIKEADDVFEELIITQYEDDKGVYWDTKKAVTINLIDGSRRDMFEILTNVLNFWSTELHHLGIIEHERHFDIPDSAIPPRRSESGASPLDLEIVQGVRFRMKSRLLKYNPSTGIAEPIDTTGSKMTMKMHKPAELTFSLVHKKTGKEISRTIEVDDKLWSDFQKLGSEEERKSFVTKLAEERNLMKEVWEETNRQAD